MRATEAVDHIRAARVGRGEREGGADHGLARDRRAKPRRVSRRPRPAPRSSGASTSARSSSRRSCAPSASRRCSSSPSSASPESGRAGSSTELRTALDDRPDLITWRHGRCLPYGEGITFWALGEIVKAEAGILESDDGTSPRAEARRERRGALRGRSERGMVRLATRAARRCRERRRRGRAARSRSRRGGGS